MMSVILRLGETSWALLTESGAGKLHAVAKSVPITGLLGPGPLELALNEI